MTTGFLETPESEKSYGYVTCRIIRRVADTPDDADAFPDILPAEGKVIFTPKQKNVTASNYSALVLNETIEAPLNSEGYAVRYKGADTTLIALVVGTYDVRFNIVSGGDIPPMTVRITSNHTQETPLDLSTIRPPAENDHTTVQIISVDPSVVDGSVLIKSGASVYGVPQSEFTGPKGDPGEPGADGRGIKSIMDDDEDGIATVAFTDGTTSELVLPRGPQGKTGPTPEVTWEGTSLTVGDQPPVDLKGTTGASIVRAIDGDGVVSFEMSDGSTTEPVILPQGRTGDTGPAPTVSWEGTSLVVGGNPPVDLKGNTGADGRGIESITDDDEDGIATVLFTDGAVDALPLPRGPKGDPAPKPEIAWAGDVLTVDGVSSPPLSGPAGPAPVTSWSGTSLIVGDNPPVDLRGPQGVRGPVGSPGAVATASDYLLVGPGRPDTPATTGGIITGSEPVGCEYRSTDGAGVGAWVWMKRPTGWEVTDGDTGWRNVTEDIVTPGYRTWYNSGNLRRAGNDVTFILRARFTSGNDKTLTGQFPLGFRAFRFNGDASLERHQTGLPAVIISGRGWADPIGYAVYGVDNGDVNATHKIIAYPRKDSSGTLAMQWATQDAWPSILPGTPA